MDNNNFRPAQAHSLLPTTASAPAPSMELQTCGLINTSDIPMGIINFKELRYLQKPLSQQTNFSSNSQLLIAFLRSKTSSLSLHRIPIQLQQHPTMDFTASFSQPPLNMFHTEQVCTLHALIALLSSQSMRQRED